MITLLRKHSQWLMIVIAILAIPFIFYFNKTDFAATRGGVVARVYGRDISAVELERSARMFDLARDLGMISFLQDLVGNAQDERQAKEQFALNRLILRHEADSLGLRATSAETAETLKKLPAFRGKDGFDIQKYNDAVQNYLGPRGFTEAQLEELAGDELALNRIKQLLGTATSVSPAESQTNFEQVYSRLEVSLIRLKSSDVANEIKISDDDIRKYYDANKDQLRSEEKRKLQFVALTLSEPEKKLTGKERVDALQKLSDKATDVSQALSEKGADFTAVAAKFQLAVATTGEFPQSLPDPQLKQDPQLAQTAFQLSEAEPISEPIQVADGFYILHLTGIVPAQPLTLEQARPKIVEALKGRQERELLGTRAAKIVRDLREALKSGESITAVAQKLNVKTEKLPPFSLADDLEPNKSQPTETSVELPQIKSAVADLQPREVTEPIPAASGMLVAILEKREPPDPAQAASKRASFDERLLRGKRMLIFYEWLRDRRRAAGIEKGAAT